MFIDPKTTLRLAADRRPDHERRVRVRSVLEARTVRPLRKR
jgi:hypothetical protein